jgi:branched-chain amino acid transport system permease protein
LRDRGQPTHDGLEDPGPEQGRLARGALRPASCAAHAVRPIPFEVGGAVIAPLIIGGLASGSLYALVGLALAIVLRATDIPNFAQGEMAMVSTFVAYSLLTDLGLGWGGAVVIALAFAALQGVLIQQIVIRPLIGGPVLSTVIATLGLNIVLHSLAGMIWGHQTYVFPTPLSAPPFHLFGVPIAAESALDIAVAVAVIIAFTLILKYSWEGIALRAASQNQTIARLMGISINRSFALAWGMGGLAGGLAGILIAPELFLDTNLMGALLIKGFAGGVLGGLGSLAGVFVGGLSLGVMENLVGAYLSPSFAEALTFLLIIAVLVVKPEGVFGHVRVRKV